MPGIILASSSPRRRELLTQIGLDYTVCASDVDESVSPTLEPWAMVESLAKRKAMAVAPRFPGSLVIGADTIVVKEGTVFGKPRDEGDARRMLAELSGTWHDVFSGVCVMETEGERIAVQHEATRVYFRELDEERIARYVASGEPMDKAGGYAIQGIGALFVKRIEGCYFNVVGLPLALLGSMLRGFGAAVL